MICLVDYGAGNLTSVRKAFAALGADVSVRCRPEDLTTSRGIVVPGVGHFDRTRAIDHTWTTAIRGAVERGIPLFGICLGMQWLFDGSDEAPGLPGFGLFRGTCVKLCASSSRPTSPTRLKIPHVGWNSLEFPRKTTLMRHIADSAQVYFTHSYVAPVVPESAAVTNYGGPFSAAVEQGRVSGVQFHPEKSGDVGLRILRNWLCAL